MTRKIREAIWIRKKSPLVMNRDKGAITSVTCLIRYYRRLQRPLVLEMIRNQHSEDDCRPRQSKLVRYVNNSLPLVLKNEHFCNF